MEVFGRVVAQCCEVDALECFQRLQQYDALAPDVARVHVDAPVGGGDAFFDGNFECGEVVPREEAAILLVERGDVLGDRSLVEAVVHGTQLGSPVAGCIALGFDHPTDGAGQVFLLEPAADRGRFAAGTEDRTVFCIAVDISGMQFDAVPQDRVHVKAVAGELHCRRGGLLVGNRAEPAQRLDVGRGRSRDDLTEDAFGHGVAAFGLQSRNVGAFRPVTEALEAHYRVFTLHENQGGKHARERHDVRLKHGQCDCCGYACIHGVASGVECAHGSSGCEVVATRGRVVAARDGRAPGDGGRLLLGDRPHSSLTPACFTILANLASSDCA